MQDIKIKRLKLQHEMEYIINFRNQIQNENDLQKLYFIDLKHKEKEDKPYYINHTFSSELVPVDLSIFSSSGEENTKVFELYAINTVEEFIRFELMNSVKNDLVINQCHCCGNFFIPIGRNDAKYCDGKAPGSKKTCREIGAILKYKVKNAEDKIYIAYNKAYKRNNSRVRKKNESVRFFKMVGAGTKNAQ